MSQSESDHSPANLASIQCRERTADFLVLIDAECERLAAENTQAQAQAEIEASSRFKNSLMVDGVIRRASRIPLSPPPNHPSIKAQAMNISEFDDAKETTDDLIQGPLPAGTVAPDFTLHATPDQQLSLHELRGNPVILAFYPADWSSVCGDQLTLYNQLLPTFKEYGATLLGISVDSAWCHQAFAKDRNFHFSLLADFEPKGAVARQYGAYESQLGVCKRALFVIDKEGVVAWSYVSPMAINPGADGILDALDALANSPQSTPTKN